MTDKFVVSTNEIGEIIVTDVETDRVYRYDDPSNFFGLIRLLNEQQATIKKQDIEIQSLNLHIKELVDGDEISQLLMREYEISDGLEKENKELKKQLKKKNTMNMQLREINKELGDDLHNCRLNKNIISEKLKLWQDTLAEYDIYTIKDFKELMKNE